MRAIFCILVLAALSAPAAAKKGDVHGGVRATALAPSGLTVGDVEAPLAAGLPARVTFVDAQGRGELVADVLVAASPADARAALAGWKDKLARADVPAASVGDESYGSGALIGFAQDNIMIAVRRVRGSRDVVAVAEHMAAAVIASPAGKTVAQSVRPKVGDLREGVPARVSVPADYIGARFGVSGPAVLRRDAEGWLITRTGAGTIQVSVVAVDAFLRVTP